MSHCDPEALALYALGEPVPADDETHLAGCLTCQDDLDQLAGVVAVGRQLTDDDTPAPPPERVWSAIAAELEPETQVIDRRRRSRGRLVLVSAAAAVIGLLVGSVGFAAISREPDGPVVASARLGPVDAGSAHGTATVRETSNGRELDVDLRELPAGDGYFEVWFMNAETGGSVSMGSLEPGREGAFPVPAGLQLTDFPYVDVSLEPLDGDPTHSSVSVARGRLEAGDQPRA